MHILKIGGNELEDSLFLKRLAHAVAVSAEPVVLVHGGGRTIAELQSRLGLEPIKVDGLRVTDAASLAVVEMVLSGRVNKRIVATLLEGGVDALGLSGVDRGLLRCRQKAHPAADLGFVGEIVAVRTEVITQLVEQGVTPVISPISLGVDGQAYNVNADEAASELAMFLEAKRLDFVSNVPGVLDEAKVIPILTPARTEQLIAAGVVRDGMVPKVRAALAAVARGVPRARIVDLAGLEHSGGTVFMVDAPGNVPREREVTYEHELK